MSTTTTTTDTTTDTATATRAPRRARAELVTITEAILASRTDAQSLKGSKRTSALDRIRLNAASVLSACIDDATSAGYRVAVPVVVNTRDGKANDIQTHKCVDVLRAVALGVALQGSVKLR